MSEYWKSTVGYQLVLPPKPKLTKQQPKYYCKHCKLYVRDTPLEKTNHEGTPRHQGNLKRFLRDLHCENERGERDKQRAKNEVERLNRIAGSSVSSPGPAKPLSQVSQYHTLRNVTPEERTRQMAQLAEMGVTVPEGFRKENAMAGEWETISRRVILPGTEEEQAAGVKPGLNVGVRKRKIEDEDEEEGVKVGQQRRKPVWGTDIKAISGDDDDLDALLNATTTIKKPPKEEDGHDKQETNVVSASVDGENGPPVKQEGDGTDDVHTLPTQIEVTSVPVKDETEGSNISSMFKKRKSKAIRTT